LDHLELPHNPYLVKSLQLFYNEEMHLGDNKTVLPGFSFLTKVRQNGHLWDSESDSYATKYLPETEFSYQQHNWNTTIQTLESEQLINLPSGLSTKNYLWVDLFSEGISGILTEQGNGWFYKSNLGDGAFSAAAVVAPKPNFTGLSDDQVSLLELEGNGTKYLVNHGKQPFGFYKLTEENEWETFKSFSSFPTTNLLDPNLRTIDLNGDGRMELVITGENKLTWYEGIGEQGFEISRSVTKEIDEEKGPAVVFADSTQSIFLADMNGDGLTDIVRIRNGEICYWPNKGYGHFGAKINMDNAPVFDHPDLFSPAYIRLADIDGSGTIDIIYLGKNDFRVWMNQHGNEWTTTPQIISGFPQIDNLSDVTVFDLLGSGTACIVYSSPIAQQPLWYIDLMAGKKPHLLIGYHNNCGKELSFEYKSSTYFYLQDKKSGNPWITKLPFPVHCIYKVRAEDKIRETVFTNSYSYHHGFYDRDEGEFRGFARVEQLDTEDLAQFKINDAKNAVEEDLHQPPVKTVSWFHTGAFLKNKKILHQCEQEYFNNTFFTEYDLPEALISGELTNDELHDAYRTCKGLLLRTEIYADDHSDKSTLPYSAAQSTYEIKLVQPKATNQYAVFCLVAAESVTYNYERNPADPRISQSVVLKTDELGNPLQVASVIYPRIKRPTGIDSIPDAVWNEQNKLHLLYSESAYTNDILQDDIYRLRVSCESKSFELSGIPQPSTFFFTKNILADAINEINADATKEIPYEEEFTIGLQKRISVHKRLYFMNDAFNGALALGNLSPLGITYKSYSLAFTKNLVTKYYGTKVSDQMLEDAKYVHSEHDEHWWTQSGTLIYENVPSGNFYLPIGSRDVYGNETSIVRDAYHLLINSSRDAIGNTASALNDYRILSPVVLTDANLNRTAIETDELGMVIKSAVMGKEGSTDGDTLADPTAKMEYELFNWQLHKQPNYAHLFSREQHGTANPRWQESFVYSDGGGIVIMAKTQAKPGKALRWNTITKSVEEVVADPRWIGNGRAILNNKGKTVKLYEPYFSTTHEYESEEALVETGITSVSYYDAIGRNIKTDFPNGTFSKVEFDSWYFKSYDTNDTVKDSTWYSDRGSPDPSAAEPADPEQRAAWLAAKHYSTPAIQHTNSLGQTIYSIADYGGGKTTHVFLETDTLGRFSKNYDQLDRLVSEGYVNLLGVTLYTKTAEKGEKWVFKDVMGRLVKSWDNNVRELRTTYDQLHRMVSAFVKIGSSEFLYNHILYADAVFDTATAQSLNMKGRAYRVYDQMGSMTIKQIDFKGNPLAMDRRLIKDYKAAITNWNALDGLTSLAAIDAAADPILETEIFAGSSEIDALNRPTRVTVHGGTVYKPVYNIANFLDSLQVQIQGQDAFTTFLEGQDYDAKGQRQFAAYGNGTVTDYFYDPKTYRLSNLLTRANSTDSASLALQNLKYVFDPVGNITQIRDDAQQTHFFKNSVIYPESKYEYDARYRLKKATGREHAGIGGNAQRNQNDLPFITPLPDENNATAVRNYTEQYDYDDLGNIKRLQHTATGANWTQRYKYAVDDDVTNLTNRLKATNAEGDADGVFSGAYTHDLFGNMTSMPHLSAPGSLIWDFADQLKEVNLGGGGKAYYVYGGGNRIRKVIERPGGKIEERIYLGSVEIYRERQGNSAPTLERYTLHVSDNKTKIAQVDIKTIDTNNSDPFNLLHEALIRYQYSNHMGSASLEANETGTVISYEEYHPYGTSSYRISKSTADMSLKRYRFSGKERDDETGFYYFGARYYAAWLGRWTSCDPGGFIGGYNLYQYCSNNPVVFCDPNGMDDYKTIWTYNPKNFTAAENKILGNSKSDPAKVQEILEAHGYKGGGPLVWKSDFGKSGGWVNPTALDPGSGSGDGTGAGKKDAAGGGTKGGDKGGGDKGGDKGSDKGSDKGAANGSDKGSDTGSANGSDKGSPGGSDKGSVNGSDKGSPDGKPGGGEKGSGQGSPDGSGSGGGGGGRKYITKSFWTGLLAGFAVALTIVLVVALAPITIPASVAIGLAVVGVGLTAYSTVQSVRQRDFFNRPISEEQANFNLGFGIGGLIGGAVGGAAVGPGANAVNQAGQGLKSFLPSLEPAFAGVPAGFSGGGTTTIVTGVSGTTAIAGAGAGTTTNILMMNATGSGGGDGSGSGSGGGGNPHDQVSYDLDDAAAKAFGEGTEAGARIGDIGPVKNQGVINDMKSIGLDPSEFRAVQYMTHGPKGNNIMTVFEADGNLFYGAHESSANWSP
jgi:RHS repeat-associated protein